MLQYEIYGKSNLCEEIGEIKYVTKDLFIEISGFDYEIHIQIGILNI